jgi:hypothetical protein
MLILPHACFLHVPKTGGSWATRAIKASGLEYEEYCPDGDAHTDLAHCPCPEKFKIAFVRHPLEILRSYWQYKMGVGWDPRNPRDVACQSGEFHVFVRNVLERFPGFCSAGFELYTGPRTAPIEFVGKYENLVDDLILGLRLAGEQFDEAAIRRIPPLNVSDKTRFPAEYTPDLEQAVKRAEREAMERYGYS